MRTRALVERNSNSKIIMAYTITKKEDKVLDREVLILEESQLAKTNWWRNPTPQRLQFQRLRRFKVRFVFYQLKFRLSIKVLEFIE